MSRFAVAIREGGAWGQTHHFPSLQAAYNWADSDCFDQEQRVALDPDDQEVWIAGNKWSSYQRVVNQLENTERVVAFHNARHNRYYILFYDPEPEWDVPPGHGMEIDE
jgi:hypothetical protein